MNSLKLVPPPVCYLTPSNDIAPWLMDPPHTPKCERLETMRGDGDKKLKVGDFFFGRESD